MTHRWIYLFFALLLLFNQQVFTQNDYSWWNEAHNWDGVSSWSDYIIFSPNYMGPNSLPVPHSQKGIIKNQFEFQLDYQYHYSAGDKTQNLFLRLYLPILENKIALEFYGVPCEKYSMNEETVYERRTRNLSGEGVAIGDFYFSTIIQLIKDKKFPDLSLRLACRTASGNMLSDARYTDAPGYFFDLSGGKVVFLNENKTSKLRFHGMLGFYVWQMNLPNNRQNDAILYGFGIDVTLDKWLVNNSIDGYYGYFGEEEEVVGNGTQPVPINDQPLLYRIEIVRNLNKFDLGFGYQLGLSDFPYQSIKLSATYLFAK